MNDVAELERLRDVVTRAARGTALPELTRRLFDEGVRVVPLLPVIRQLYVVCNTLLDPEENRYCEFDSDVTFTDGRARCPSCRRILHEVEGDPR